MKSSLLILLGLLLSACAYTSLKKSDYKFEYGIYHAYGGMDVLFKPSHVAEKITAIDHWELVEPTDQIKAVQGARFGIEYFISSEVYGDTANVREVVTFPQAGLYNPISGKTMKTAEYERVEETDQIFNMAYKLSELWEVKEGEWVFEVYINGLLEIKKAFLVAKKS